MKSAAFGSHAKITILSLSLLICSVCAWTQAPVYYTDPGRPNNTGNGRSWATAKQTLQAAIDATTTAHQVWAKTGSYAEAVVLKSNVALYGGFSGAGETTMAQRNIARNPAVINPSAVTARPAVHPVTINNISNCRLDGFTLTGGVMASGLFCAKTDGSVVIANCTIRGNVAENGGGIYIETASPLITSCTISHNIGARDDITYPTNAYGRGGGIEMFDSTPTITHCLIVNNRAGTLGGGINSVHFSLNPLLGATIDSCVISGNQAGIHGGGIYDTGHIATISNCIISANSALYGGGIEVTYPAHPLTISNTTFAGNTAQDASAIYCGNTGKLTLRNNIFANQQGNLIEYWVDTLNAEFNHCLFYNPGGAILSRYGTAIYQDPRAVVLNMAGSADNYEGDPCFTRGATGTWTTAPIGAYDDRLTTYCTRLFDAGAALTPGALAGRMIRPDATRNLELLIQDNTTTSILVIGHMQAYGQAGMRWQMADYHLGAGSAAAGRGALAGAPATDIDSQARPGVDDLIDIGADEATPPLTPARDAAAPASQITNAPAQAFTTSFMVYFHAIDTQSRVREVQLYYRRNGGAWTRYSSPATVYTPGDSPVAFDTTLTGGDGFYELYTVAVDNDGNTEAAPASPDATVCVVSRLPGARLYVNESATGGARDGLSWATACREVSDALTEAAVLGGVKEIWVARGRYRQPMSFPSNVAVYGGFAGRETSLEERSPTTYVTNIDGFAYPGSSWTTPMIRMNNCSNSRLDGFQVTYGGISCNLATSCTISNCTIGKNINEYYGYGISAANSVLSVVRCTISQNDSGGISLNNCIAAIEECALYNCGWPGSIATGAGQGGLTMVSSHATLRGCTVADNLGGGVHGSKSWLTADRCWLFGNNGGAITLTNDGSIVYCEANLSNTIISGNYSAYGTAINAWAGCGVNLINCTLADQNTGDWGGAVWFQSAFNGTIKNTIFHHNIPNAVYEMVNPGWAAGKTIQNCLFDQGPAGDLVLGDGNPAISGATAINLQMPGAEGNITGSPAFAAAAIQGKWTAVGAYNVTRGVTPLYDAKATLTPGALAGKTIAVNTSQTQQMLVLDNTTTAVLVAVDIQKYYRSGTINNLVGQAWNTVDYRTGASSAGYDAGAAGALTADYEGNPRPVTPGDTVHPKFDLGAYEFQGTGAIPASHTLTAGGTHGTVQCEPKQASYPQGSMVLLTPRPDSGYRFAGWSGNVPPGGANTHPLPLTMDGDKTLTALFAGDRDVVVRIDVRPATGSWTFEDGRGVMRSGTGSTVLTGPYASPIVLDWCSLANYDLPTPGAEVRDLAALGNQVSFSGSYTPNLGAVNINVWPANAAWTLNDGLGGVRRGSGSARVTGVLCGARALSVLAPAGFQTPQPNPIAFTVTQGREATVSLVLLPGTGDSKMAYARILRYLLGLSADATGLDVNGDSKVNASDLLKTIKGAQ